MKVEQLHELPKSWEWTKLGDIGSVASGGTPSTKDMANFGGQIPWITPADLSGFKEKFISRGERNLTERGLNSSSATLLPAGTVLFSSRAPVGYVAIAENAIATNQGFKNLIPSDIAFNEYIYYYLKGSKHLAESYASGTTFLEISGSRFAKLPVPLAPLPEQHRIVAKIEELFNQLDAGVESLKTVKVQLQAYRQSVLKAAIGGNLVPIEAELARAEGRGYEHASFLLESVSTPPRPYRYKTRSRDVILGHAALAVGNPNTQLPEGWTWAPLLDIARLESGHTPSRRHPEWWEGEIPWMGIPDARDHHGGVIHDTRKHTNEEGLANSAARLLPAGTVCLSRTASVGYVVKMGRPMATSQDFVNWICASVLDPDWLQCALVADRDALLRFGKGSVHKTIYYPEVLSFHLALPPLGEQKRIVAEVDRRLSLAIETENRVEVTVSQGKRLRQAIFQKAFSGKLVPQDPGNEPADILLEKIKRQGQKSRISAGRAPQSQIDSFQRS